MKSIQDKTKNSTKWLSASAMRVLHIGLPPVLAELIFLLFSFLRDRTRNATYALYYYPILLEYIMMSLTLIVIGAFLFDYLSRKK